MVNIVDLAAVRRASNRDATAVLVRSQAAASGALLPLTAVDPAAWRLLAEHVIEPNGYYLPEWELAVNATSPGRTDASVLAAWSNGRLSGLLPVVSMMRAIWLPLPALFSARPYGTLCTPLLDRDTAEEAASMLIKRARDAGAHALVLRDVPLDGRAFKALKEVLRREGLRPRLLQWHLRAFLNAAHDGDKLLLDALGSKKLKELRRQSRRLAEHGEIRFDIARSPTQIEAAIETFLQLEAGGWKGERGTALAQVDGDAAFIRRATRELAETGECEVISLWAGATPVASGIVLRHQTRAFFFKLGIDERFARYSPGVQLTLELTRRLCADPNIKSADSTASADHPMINPIWRGRLAIGDVLIPLRPNDPVVTLIHGVLLLRQMALEVARWAVRTLRGRRTR